MSWRGLALAAFAAGCGGGTPAAPTERLAPEGSMPITVTSPAFAAGAAIPKKHSLEEGPNASPALAWSGIPPGTREIALLCDDPDAPRPKPWVHWVVANIPPATAALPEGVPKGDSIPGLAGAVQGKNDFGFVGYGGPAPPPGHGTHHYHFKVYALKEPLAAKPGITKDQLLAAIKGKVLAEGDLVGTYSR
ncbi:MAG: YbhB/YbcL family Raf kinase inhibitor-like protein [Planctomycetales bacterium]|nr:YbhB/YbcL family Raf kinase inhibitor-like protein [Planctomycetales bacterium]